MKKTILLYGLLGGVLIALLKLIEYRFLVVEHSLEIYGGLVAALFAGLGIWLGLKLTRPRETVVVREVPVTIPDVVGDELDGASGRLEALGLKVETEEGGGLFDDLLPGDTGVCAIEPAAGTEVKPGSTVTLRVARVC